jgi:hypothetical protein
MKKTVIGMVFMAAAYAAFGNGQWAAADRAAYDGESEVLFSYRGPEGVSARVYEDGTFIGSLNTGETKRRVAADGSHTYRVAGGVYDAATKKTIESPHSSNIRIDTLKNRSTVRIVIANENGENRVTELALAEAVAIQTRPKPVEGSASAPAAATPAPTTPTPPAGAAVMAQTSGATFYVSATGDDEKDGLTEATAFKTLFHAVFQANFDDAIKTITVIGTLNQASEGRDNDDVFFLSSFGDDPILITGIPNAPAGRRAVLSAAGTQKACVCVSGLFSPATAVRFEHIEISGSSKLGLEVSLDTTVTLGPGSTVRNNSDCGVWVNKPEEEYRDRVSSGHLILDGGIVENNKREFAGGGIRVMGAFTMKRGSVRNNTAVPNAKGNSYGGGISIESKDPVSIEGGDISGNMAAMGGGIFIYEGNVTMSGGSISGNTATSGVGGVWVAKGETFTQRGGTVSGNKAPSDTRKDTWDILRMDGSS